MSLFAEIFRFECRYQLRSPLFLVVAGLWFLIAFLVTASESVRVGGVGDNLNLNANFAILQVQYTLSILGMFPAVAFVAGAITRDYEQQTAQLLFATGVEETSYLLGRFAGGTLFAVLVGIAALVGTLVGSFMPWLDPERLGPFSAAPYLFSIWGVIVPNLVIICALFFSVAALTRSMMAAYVAALGFILIYIVLGNVTDQETIEALALGDPFGTVAFGELTRYWTVFDRNHGMPELTGTLLLNRLIWFAVAAVVLGFTAWRYRFNLSRPPRLRLRLRRARRHAEPAPRLAPAAAARIRSGPRASLACLASQLRMDIRGMTRSVPFYVLLAFGMLQVVGSFVFATSQNFGTPVYPLTGMLISVVQGSFSLAVIIIVIYYSGELVHRERQARVADIVDATPVPDVVMVLSKIGALWFVLVMLMAIVMLTSIVVQALNDFHRFELSLYVVGLFGVIGAWYYLLCVPAVLIQVLTPNKFLGMVIFLALFLGLQTLPSLDLEHYLYRFALPPAPYSDMNGYGHYLGRLVSYVVYWGAFCGMLVVLAHLFFRRGLPGEVGAVVAEARRRFGWPARVWLGAFAVVFVVSGVWIYYNSNVLNTYRTAGDREAAQADYEKAFKQFQNLPQPAVTDIDVAVDLFPEERRLESSGRVQLANRESEALEELHLSLSPLMTVSTLSVDGAELAGADERLGYYRFRFEPALAPGAGTELRWALSWRNPGFTNGAGTTRVVANGTFVDNTEIMPVPGYDRGRELTDNNVRREQGLPPVQRLPQLGDPDYLTRSQFGVAERSAFRATISTSADQIAVAPGYLARDWVDGGRRYFSYEMDVPIWPFVSFSSARYAVAEDVWNDVALSVYHHPGHDFNTARMLEASKRSLDYFTREFSPYQYRQFRILEFPRYQIFAQSFPNTIPYSEAIGFVADLRDEKRIDYVFYVTAHEMAHQWWAHQVVGAQMQGMTMLVETLAQYSALMVMEKAYGSAKMRRFLKYELDRYLQGRGGELIEELPLKLVENQPYVHYRKGSLAMYALKEAIGEDQVNLALRRFLDEWAFRSGRFPTSADLIAEFRAVADAPQQDLITDLFEKIVLYDLKVVDASTAAVADGLRVTMTVEAHKFEADGMGRETEVTMDEELTLALFPPRDGSPDETLGEDDLPAPIWIDQRRLTGGRQTISVDVDVQPGSAGIDPYLLRIDRNPDDNVRPL